MPLCSVMLVLAYMGYGGNTRLLLTRWHRTNTAQNARLRFSPLAQVGYHVRLDAAATADTRLLFCTTGILLRRLAGEPALGSVSHVIVDEVRPVPPDIGGKASGCCAEWAPDGRVPGNCLFSQQAGPVPQLQESAWSALEVFSATGGSEGRVCASARLPGSEAAEPGSKPHNWLRPVSAWSAMGGRHTSARCRATP